MINKTNSKKTILVDGRWSGTHGIGRFSSELLARLHNTVIFEHGPKPLSLKNLLWQTIQLRKPQNQCRVFFTPGFNPIFQTKTPYVLTICDLIYLHTPGLKGFAKKIFFEYLVKHSVKRASKILTISDYSKKSILSWAKIPPDKVINVGCGISAAFTAEGIKHTPGYDYLLHVGNTKPHKNIVRLLHAFANADINPTIKLILTGCMTPEITRIIREKNIQSRIVFATMLTETELANYYRGAYAFVFPSLQEGFGLPILEAMACGTPVLTSNTTSCPEVAGNAAVLVDPYDLTYIKAGIENIVNNSDLRTDLIQKGFIRASYYSWDKTAAIAQQALDAI